MHEDFCPSQLQLEQYASGTIDPTDLESVSTHIDRCAKCREDLELLSSTPSGLPIESNDFPCDEPEYIAAVSKILRYPLDAPQRSLAPGQQLNDYHLLEILGEGGMGTVYKARHVRLNKIVALKVVRRNTSIGSSAWMRFEREMQAVGRLKHPNIVQATDAGDADGIPYLVMEYVEGFNLAQDVKRNGPLQPERAFEVIRQAACGLQHAHDAGLIHRDIKPSNLMLTAEGQIKVLDLGLAAFAEVADVVDASQEADSSRSQDLTSVNHLLGTKEFMAPEQRKDPRTVDARADVYALGGTLWYLLTGNPPHQGPPPDVLPNGVWKKLLAENPSERVARASDVVALLPAKRQNHTRYVIAAALLIALITGALFVLQFNPDVQNRPEPDVIATNPVLGTMNMNSEGARRFQQDWAGHLGKPVISDGTNGHRFALIGPGIVPLGTACTVTITKPYELSITETTFGQFETFVNQTGYKTTAETDDRGGHFFDPFAPSGQKFKTGRQYTWRTPGHGATEAQHPVTTISYEDALAYCHWLTRTTKQIHRLPTEAEWLWAYRAGDSADPCDQWAKLTKMQTAAPCWIRITIDGNLRPQQVATSMKNIWGLHEMIGNVYEYCADEFADYPTESKTDYCCRASQHKFAVIQGHCYYSMVPNLIHSRGREDSSREGVGFRILREVDVP